MTQTCSYWNTAIYFNSCKNLRFALDIRTGEMLLINRRQMGEGAFAKRAKGFNHCFQPPLTPIGQNRLTIFTLKGTPKDDLLLHEQLFQIKVPKKSSTFVFTFIFITVFCISSTALYLAKHFKYYFRKRIYTDLWISIKERKNEKICKTYV